MKIENIQLGENVVVHPSSSINNINMGNQVRVAKRCSLFGNSKNPLMIGEYSYVGMNTFIDGFNEKITIGSHVSIAPNVNIVSGSGPNASPAMQRVMPIVRKPVSIGDHTWIGTGAVILPGVTLGKYCVVAAKSVVNRSFPDFSIVGGMPAKKIREFTDAEKELLLGAKDDYESEYANLQFEHVLHGYRYQKILEVIESNPHQRILEIGSGPTPLFSQISDFEKMTIIEPRDVFFKQVQALGAHDKRINFIHGLFEDVIEQLKDEVFDVIIVGGFLHEIDNPDQIIQALKRVCTTHTVVHSYVPNAKSFHRLLAMEMGIIDTLYQMSGNDVLFKRRVVFDQELFDQLFHAHGFNTIASGSYFIKPFSHKQMHQLISVNIINDAMMDGLDKMIKHMPGLGAELFFTGSLTKGK
ncbi:MAG: methyltransferase domain-containing protein [Cyclobacteriaceae bacterium]|nr:methyltransferase domain-containing protein [Cyclobacteriaceae bacterium]